MKDTLLKTNIRQTLHKTSVILFFFYIASVYICSFLVELNMISLVVFAMFFGSTVFYIALRGDIIIPKGIYFHIVFFFFIILSCYWIMEDITSFQRIGTIPLLLLLSLTIVNVITSEKNFDLSMKMLFFAGIAMCIYSLIFYGYDGTLAALSEGQEIRLGQEINEANIFGMICAFTTVIGIYYIFCEKKWLYIVITSVPLLYTLASGSRMAFLMIGASVFVLLLLKKSKNIFKTIFVWAIVFCAILILLRILSKSNIFIFQRFEMFLNIFKEETFFRSADNSSLVRFNMMKYGLKWFLEKPVLGWGTDQYAVLYYDAMGTYRYSHSNIIEVLVNHGVVGFVFYYGIYAYITYYIIKAMKTKLPYSECLLMLLGALLIANIFFVMLYLKITYILIGIFLSYIFINKSKLQTAKILKK